MKAFRSSSFNGIRKSLILYRPCKDITLYIHNHYVYFVHEFTLFWREGGRVADTVTDGLYFRLGRLQPCQVRVILFQYISYFVC